MASVIRRISFLWTSNNGKMLVSTDGQVSQRQHRHIVTSTEKPGNGITSQTKLKPLKDMPGPRGLPVLGTLWDYTKKDGYRFNKMFLAMQELANVYGPIYQEKIAHFSHVVISDPHEYAKVIRADGKYPYRIEMEPIKHYRTKRGYMLGLVNGQGEEWHRHRTVLSKKLLRPKEVHEYIAPMNDVSNDFMTRLRKIRQQDGTVPNLEHELFKWAMESVGTMIFEERIGCFNDPMPRKAEEFIRNLVGFFRTLQPLMYDVPTYKFYQHRGWKQFEQYTDGLLKSGLYFVNKKLEAIQRQRMFGVSAGDTEEKSAFLTYLLTQKSLTAQEANLHAVDLMTGAVETTTNATLFLLYCLATNPVAQHTLYEEVMELLYGSDVITLETLSRCQYVKACLKETFRLFPITFATSRILHKDIEIAGYLVPAGTHVQANLYGMGHNPKLFENPGEFRPERWLRDPNDGGGRDAVLQAVSSLTWGHGARMCIGRRIAEQEIFLNIIKIIQNFSLSYDAEEILPVLNTVMTPDRPLLVKFTPRN